MQCSISCRLTLAATMIGVSIMMIAASEAASEKPSVKPTILATANAQKVAAGYNALGFRLLRELAAHDKANLSISPYSLAAALAMLDNGAHGKTQQELRRLLGTSTQNEATLNAANYNLRLSLINADPKVQLHIANSLWADKNFAFKSTFLQNTKQFFNAQAASVNMKSPEAKKRINDWVSKQTKGKIPTMLEDTSQLDAVLLNAVYFKSNWQTKFDKKLTTNAPFYSSGAPKTVPFMLQTGSFTYHRGADFQMLALPYASGRLQAWLLLPDKGRSLTELMKRLDSKTLAAWQKQAVFKPGTVRLPRFKFERGLQLNAALQKLGLVSAFKSGANFSRLGNASTFISEVRQKTFIEVNEEGTEAAAASSIGMMRGPAPPPETPFVFTADRPFLMLIQDKQSGALLFACRVAKP